MYLVDTSAWIEILQKTSKGQIAGKKLFPSFYFTPSISMAELSKWAYANGIESKTLLSKVEVACDGILNTTRESEQLSGYFWTRINSQKPKKDRQVGLIDCIIAAIAKENNLTVITKDNHFSLFKEIKKEIL